MVYPQQLPPGEYPPPGEYGPEYYNGYGPRPWVPRVHTGFRYFLLLLVVLLIANYFTGNPLLPTNGTNPSQSNAVNSSNQANQNDLDANPSNNMTATSNNSSQAPVSITTTTVAPASPDASAYSGVPLPSQNGVDAQTEMSIRQSQAAADANFDARIHKLKAIKASAAPAVPDGWYTWSVEKRARYVRALMDRIDAP